MNAAVAFFGGMSADALKRMNIADTVSEEALLKYGGEEGVKDKLKEMQENVADKFVIASTESERADAFEEAKNDKDNKYYTEDLTLEQFNEARAKDGLGNVVEYQEALRRRKERAIAMGKTLEDYDKYMDEFSEDIKDVFSATQTALDASLEAGGYYSGLDITGGTSREDDEKKLNAMRDKLVELGKGDIFEMTPKQRREAYDALTPEESAGVYAAVSNATASKEAQIDDLQAAKDL
jgi:hypothetical protein